MLRCLCSGLHYSFAWPCYTRTDGEGGFAAEYQQLITRRVTNTQHLPARLEKAPGSPGSSSGTSGMSVSPQPCHGTGGSAPELAWLWRTRGESPLRGHRHSLSPCSPKTLDRTGENSRENSLRQELGHSRRCSIPALAQKTNPRLFPRYQSSQGWRQQSHLCRCCPHLDRGTAWTAVLSCASLPQEP